MTPASGILHWMAAHASKYGVVVKQAEDELAAINMAIGASHAGVRSMVATSGGGYSLMVEATGLAGMTETPVVIVEAQRAGPSTGLPTKTEQGDLNMMLGASQGDFPRAIIAPRNVEECFYQTARAFNLADRYQGPVFVAEDLYLAEGLETVDTLDLNVPIDRGLLADGEGEFKRYKFTGSGVSPRAFPGQEGRIFVAASDEHDEKGVLVSDVLAGVPEHIETRRLMVEKRMRKMKGMLSEMRPPELHGPGDAEVTLVCWSSTQGPVREAVKLLEKEGVRASSLEFVDIYPMRGDVGEMLRSCRRLVAVENNYTGQLARLVRAETGVKIPHKILKYDGEPFYPQQIVARVREALGQVSIMPQAPTTAGLAVLAVEGGA